MLAVASPALAQQPDDGASPAILTAEQALEKARSLYAVRPPAEDPCPPQKAGEIVVCRQVEDPEKLRVPSSTDDAIERGVPVYDVPRAPEVLGLPSCGEVKCQGFGSVPPPAVMIDLKALPEPPAGSDAAAYGYDDRTETPD